MSYDKTSDRGNDMGSSSAPSHSPAVAHEVPAILQQLYTSSLELSQVVRDHGMQGILNQLKAILQSNQERLKPKEPVTFTKFSRFPPEIRVMVWHHAATIPQLIGVDDWPGGRFDGTPLKGAPIRCPLLLVNWEARIEVLKFKKNLNCRDWEENRRDPKIYANLDTDIIWLRSHFDMNGYRDRDWARFFQKLRQGRFRKVRRLAIGYQMYKYLLNEDLWHRQPVTFFDLNVEEVILLVTNKQLESPRWQR